MALLLFPGRNIMSGSRVEPETVVVGQRAQRAAPGDRAPRPWTEDARAQPHTVREPAVPAVNDEVERQSEDMDEPGYGHGV